MLRRLIIALLISPHLDWSRCGVLTVTSQRVFNLDATTFREKISHDTLILISFNAPWCGHCTSMVGELKTAAITLHKEKLNGRIAVMDATQPANKIALKGESIVGYPSFVAYRNGFRVGVYDGPRTAKDILNFMRKKLGDAFIPISTVEELMTYTNQIDAQNSLSGGIIAVVLGLFRPAQYEQSMGVYGTASQTLVSVAEEVDFVTFLMADSAAMVEHFGITQDSMLVFRDGKTTIPEGIIPIFPHTSAEEMTYEMLRHSVPLIINFNKNTQPLIHTLPIKMHVLLFYPPVKAVPVPVKSTTASSSSSPSSSLSPSSSSSHSNTEGKGKGKGDAERSDDVKILDLDFELPTACTSEEGGDENGVCAFLKTLHPEETTPHAETNTDMNMGGSEGGEGGSEDGEGGSEGGGDEDGHLDPLMTVEKALSGTAEQFRGRVTFIRIPATEVSLRQFFELPPHSDTPVVVAADMSDPSNLKRYDFLHYITQTTEYQFFDGRKSRPDMPETEAAIKRFFNAVYLTDFIEMVLAGTLGQLVKSEIEEPAVANSLQGVAGFSGDDYEGLAGAGEILKDPLVVKLVGSDFTRRVVENKEADSFVYFFVPWCAHCKAFEIILHHLSLSLSSDPFIQIARIDSAKNDVLHPKVKINAFPSFYFFPLGDQNNPIEYDGERSVEAILNFINTFRKSKRVSVRKVEDVDVDVGIDVDPLTEVPASDSEDSEDSGDSEDDEDIQSDIQSALKSEQYRIRNRGKKDASNVENTFSRLDSRAKVNSRSSPGSAMGAGIENMKKMKIEKKIEKKKNERDRDAGRGRGKENEKDRGAEKEGERDRVGDASNIGPKRAKHVSSSTGVAVGVDGDIERERGMEMGGDGDGDRDGEESNWTGPKQKSALT